jgi:hypothetical protein
MQQRRRRSRLRAHRNAVEKQQPGHCRIGGAAGSPRDALRDLDDCGGGDGCGGGIEGWNRLTTNAVKPPARKQPRNYQDRHKEALPNLPRENSTDGTEVTVVLAPVEVPPSTARLRSAAAIAAAGYLALVVVMLESGSLLTHPLMQSVGVDTAVNRWSASTSTDTGTASPPLPPSGRLQCRRSDRGQIAVLAFDGAGGGGDAHPGTGAELPSSWSRSSSRGRGSTPRASTAPTSSFPSGHRSRHSVARGLATS